MAISLAGTDAGGSPWSSRRISNRGATKSASPRTPCRKEVIAVFEKLSQSCLIQPPKLDGSDINRFMSEISRASHENVVEARALEKRISEQYIKPLERRLGMWLWNTGKRLCSALTVAAGATTISTTKPMSTCIGAGIGYVLAVPRAPMANDVTRLRRLAQKVDLLQSRDEAIEDLQRLAVTVMCLGRGEDCDELVSILGKDFLRRTLRESPAILFRERDW
jgi:hypothetical protein